MTASLSETTIRRQIREGHRARSAAERARAVALNAHAATATPDKDTRKLIRTMEEAQRELVSVREARAAGKSVKGRPKIGELMRTIANLSRQIGETHLAQTEKRWAGFADTEAVALAMGRGENLPEVATAVSDWARNDDGTLKRIDGRPVLITAKAKARLAVARRGLADAYEGGALDGGIYHADKLFNTAKLYREAFVMAEGHSTPARDPGAPAAQRCKPSPGPQDAILGAAETLAMLRGRKATKGPDGGFSWPGALTDRELAVLDSVCGHDETCSATAVRLNADHRTVKAALLSGLTRAHRNHYG